MSQHGKHGARARSARTSPFEDGIVRASTLEDLGLIEAEEVSAVIVRRPLPRALRRLPGKMPDAGFCRMVPLGADFRAGALIGTEFSQDAAQVLAREMGLVHEALRAIGGGVGYAQLAVTASDECRKFHIDYYRLRLLVTYAGPGTEIAPERGIDRRALAKGGDDVEAANRAILSPAVSPIATGTGEVVLLKGNRWGSGLPAVHRSPPIASRREVRLLLKLTVE